MARKQIALMILTLMLSSILAGCINNDSDESTDSSESNDPVNPMTYVRTGAQAPDCESNNLGILIYVEDEKQFQYCSAVGWSVLELDLPSGLDGTNGTNGVDGLDGTDGADGMDGIDGTSIISEKTVEPAGENCPYGGTKITIGTDLDGDWEIDLGSEIMTTFECDPQITYLYNYQSSENIDVIGNSQLLDGDIIINDYNIRPTLISDDPYSLNTQFVYSSSSAFAKAAAINDASSFTEVYATALPTEVIANVPISQVTLDYDNMIQINGVPITGFTVLDNDAGVSSINGTRIAQYTSSTDITVSGPNDALLDQDYGIIPGAMGTIDDIIYIRATLETDDTVSTLYNSASAIAKAAAINDSTQYTGVTATAEPTVVVANADISQVSLNDFNIIYLNGVPITGFTVLDNDAGVSSINGPRIAQYTSSTGVDVMSPIYSQSVQIESLDGQQMIDIRASSPDDDVVSTQFHDGSAIAKAAAINDSTRFTGVTAIAEPTVVVGTTDIVQVSLNSNNLIRINDAIISGFTVIDDDAGVSSINGPRVAHYTSSRNIAVSGLNDALFDQDIVIIPGAMSWWYDGIDIRATVDSDDTVSTIMNSASAIAKAAAINDSTQYTGVTATVEPTVVVGTADISAVTFDSNNHISINGQEISGISIENNDATSTLRNEINDYQTVTGVSASLDSNNRLLLTALDGRNIEISIIGDGTRTGLAGGAGEIVIGGKLTLTSNETFQITGNAIGKLGDIGGHGESIFAAVLADGTENLRSAINYYSSETGVFATLDENHRLVLTAPDGRNIDISTIGHATRLGLSAAAGNNVYGGKITLTSNETFYMSGNTGSLGYIGAYGQGFFATVLADGTENLRSAINYYSDQTGVIATLDENHRLVLTAPDGRNIELGVYGDATRLGLSAGVGETVHGGKITLTSDETFRLHRNAFGKLGGFNYYNPSLLTDGTENLRSAINYYSDQTGVFATLDENYRLALTAPDGRNIELVVYGDGTRLGLSAAAGTSVYGGKISLSSDKPFNLSGNALEKLGHIGSYGMTEFGEDDNNDNNSNSGRIAATRDD